MKNGVIQKQRIIQSIQGLGPKISEKLINHFLTEENVINAISEARISEISSIKGIGQKMALKIIQEFHSDDESGVYTNYTNQILMTDDILKVYDRIIEILKSYAQTQYIKDKFSLMYPLPATKLNIIKSRLENYRNRLSKLNKINEETIEKIKILLKKIKPFKPQTFKDKLLLHRIIVTDNKKQYNELIELDIEKYCKLLLIESLSEKVLDYLNSFDLVIFISNDYNNNSFTDQIKNAIFLDINEFSVTDLLPESVICDFLGVNYNILIAGYKLFKILKQELKQDEETLEGFKDISMELLKGLILNLAKIDKDGEIKEENYPEYDEALKIVNSFDGIIADQEIEINESIENEIKKSKAVLEGGQIFNLLKSVDDSNSISLNALMEFLPLDIAGIIEEILMEAREKLIERLNLEAPESSIVFELYPNDMNFPIEADNFILEKLKNNLIRREKILKFEILTQLAKNLSAVKPLVAKLLNILFELDELLAISSIMKDYNLTYPNFVEDKLGLSFEGGINLFLKHEQNIEIKQINYHVGNIPVIFENRIDIKNNLIILTGANSGGKTTLLQTIAQITIMAQMGLPVAAQAVNIGLFNELFFFSKSQGSNSSGAFESSVKNFTDIIISKKEKLVLVDELEAITEPGAAAKVIGSILEMLGESNNSCTVLVSHLASQVLKVIKTNIRVDGIEANGIDAEGRLIVDRNPKFNYLAKSMPYYIIKKLQNSSSNPEKTQIYQKMMNYFEKEMN